jgi:hypothetical protein
MGNGTTGALGKGSICGAVAAMLTGWLTGWLLPACCGVTGSTLGGVGTYKEASAAEVVLIAGADFFRGLSHFSQRMPPPVISQPHMKHFRAMRTLAKKLILRQVI